MCGCQGARHPADLQQPELYAPAAVAQLGSDRARDLCDLLHHAGQHPNPVSQQGAVGRMVNVGFHHRRVHAHPSSGRHAFFESYFHHPLVNLLEHLRPERHPPAAHRFGIRHFAAADAGKVAVHQIGSQLAF
jgi:hypothetical protein